MKELELAKQLSNEALISKLSRCVREDRELSARLLAQLGEVDARELYRDEGFRSMFDYCVRSLQMSESEADLRIKAARIGRQFPRALEMLARGELHMTALRLLAPVLNASNAYLLNEACFKSKLEVKELLAKHFPMPDVAESMRRLPQPRSAPTVPQSQLAELSNLGSANLLQLAVDPPQQAAQLASPEAHSPVQTSGTQIPSVQTSGAPLRASGPSRFTKNEPAVSVPLSEGRYKVVFTASQALHEMLKEARDLCCDDVPNGSLATIVETALVLLIAQKKKQRFALTSRPRKQWVPRSGAGASAKQRDDECVSTGSVNGGARAHAREAERMLARSEEGNLNSRYIPSALRREVYTRDGGQCTFASKSGTRCGTCRDLEFHHIVPFAQGGEMTTDNLTLMCRVHNALLAERDYGRDYVKSRIAKRRDQPRIHRTTEPGPESPDRMQS